MNKQGPNGIETWREIPGYEGIYSISNFGRVLSRHTSHSKIMKPRWKSSGYQFVSVCKDRQHKNFYVHHLVAYAFIGPRPAGLDINHKDGDKSNNHASNLEYVSRAENMRHARECGLFNNYGSGHYAAKLTEELVREIRFAHSQVGIDPKQIAETLRVNVNTIRDVILRRTWRHVI